MTLREALGALHRAGRIRSPWLPGMLVSTGRDEICTRITCRLSWSDACRWHGSYDTSEKPIHGGWLRILIGAMVDYEPDPSDPATVGCLAALAREADGRAGLFAAYISEPPEVWEVVAWDPEIGTADAWPGSPARDLTEGEAWAAALIAMAEALP